MKTQKRMPLLDLLEQKEIWINRAGQRVKIAKMDFIYAQNILHWLEVRADFLKWSAELRWLGFIEMLNGEMARDCAEHEFGVFMDIRADKWLRRRPLIRALKARIAEEVDYG